jgi:hypothetical protein
MAKSKDADEPTTDLAPSADAGDAGPIPVGDEAAADPQLSEVAVPADEAVPGQEASAVEEPYAAESTTVEAAEPVADEGTEDVYEEREVPVDEPRNFVPSDADVNLDHYVGTDPEYVRVNEVTSALTDDDFKRAEENAAGAAGEVETVTVAETVAAQVEAGQQVGTADNTNPGLSDDEDDEG